MNSKFSSGPAHFPEISTGNIKHKKLDHLITDMVDNNLKKEEEEQQQQYTGGFS